MSELPRPCTPGPWASREGGISGFEVVCPNIYPLPQTVGDADAIAALPDWIDAHDEWKARAEKAEADLAEIATAWRSPNLAPDQMEEAVERILADYWNAE
jgi:hypothetical protein